MASTDLEITTETREGADGTVAILRVAGEIDLANADRLGATLAAPQCRDAGRVVLDLTGVPFIDSSGLAVLLTARKTLDGGLAVVVAPDSPVGRLLGIAGLETHLRASESEAEALAALERTEEDAGG